MKHGKLHKLLALVLVLCMSVSLVVPAYAAGGGSSSTAFGRALIQSWNSFWDKLFGGSDDAGDADLTLVEDETTVSEGTQLRASTYALSERAGSTTTLKYFPVTLYDYDASTINNATYQADSKTGTGIYFNDGNPKNKTSGNGGNYNYWTGFLTTDNTVSSSQTKQKGYVYSGLVKNSLNNGQIEFTVSEGGIFDTSDTKTKNVYTKVGLPFVYDEDGFYTFDASQDGAYFSGDPASNTNLTWSDTAQKNGDYGNGFYPFNSGTTVSNPDYHFGMLATIPFSMTTDGKVSSTSDQDIQFDFAGDDDVWVFIDGVLVLDMGGIHDSVSGSINFATNEISVGATSSSQNSGAIIKDGTSTSGKITGRLFNDENGNGVLNTDRVTFAATDQHTLTVYYLERGKGASNCKIRFNLPMKDTVSVTKRATQSISSDGTVSPLTAAEQAVVDNINFGFTLYKDNDSVKNATYNLYNVDNQYISTASTDANGHFTLQNGQTARFVGEIATSGATYRVEEDIPNNVTTTEDGELLYTFSKAVYTYGGTAAGKYTVDGASYSTGSAIPETEVNITSDDPITSAAVTAKGSDEAEDSLQFVCENYFNANLPNPSSRPVDDQIVIDYGLPVVIDVLANDVYRGDSIEITDVKDAKYGTATIENGKITYQLTEQLTGVEVLTYTAKVTGSGNSGSTTTTASESKTAKVYIIPATSMYYEENFSNMVTFTGGWKNEGNPETDPQEPGVVGTVGDSPYGSDAAYLNDNKDSNGSSKYVDTTNGEASFSYTFTGEGTAFFARTSANTAYMRVVVTNITDEDNPMIVKDLRRNTIYKAVDGTNVGTLYNIPVFIDEHFDNYGTYKVEVTIMKANAALNRGSDFYLDGIRVYLPLDSEDENVSIAKRAYATDGEANMTVVTLRNKLLTNAVTDGVEAVTDANGNPVYDADGNQVFKPVLVWAGENFVLFTDSNGAITSAEDYRSNGPKEEVYLNEGQSVTFSLSDWDANSNKIYLGIKAPTGSGNVSINGNTLTINNAADCYYDISSYATITTDEDGVKIATFKIQADANSLISVTNIKVTGNAQFTIVDQDDIEADVEGE